MTNPRWRKELTPCEHCGAPYRGQSTQKFCKDCVDGTYKDSLKWRSTIRMYGVDKVMWDAMYFEQDGNCLICNEREAVCLDHSHDTGKPRGLLCLGCNTLLGFMEAPGRLDAALAYLGEHS